MQPPSTVSCRDFEGPTLERCCLHLECSSDERWKHEALSPARIGTAIPSRSGQSPVVFQPWRSTPPSPCIHPSYVFPTGRPTPQLTSDQPREDPSPSPSSTLPPPPPPPHPAPDPSNADIEVVIQMTTFEQDRLPIPNDTRTRLFVGNVRSFSLIFLSSLTEIAASLSSSLAGP